ncbi:MAG: tRNA-guanine transglycosylase [Minisyncoccia bacterium]
MLEIIYKDQKTAARCGKIETAKGIIETPAFILKTHNILKPLEEEKLKEINTQIIKTDAYEIWKILSDEGINFSTGIYDILKWHGPIMTDSGSLEIIKIKLIDQKNNILNISNSGIHFKDHRQGIEDYFDAETSLKIQEELNPDIITAFDLPNDFYFTSNKNSTLNENKNQALETLEKSQKWQIRFLEAKTSTKQVYGVLGGGIFNDLIELSSQFLKKFNFDGIIILNTLQKPELKEILKIIDLVNKNTYEIQIKHIKNIESIKELFEVIKKGIDVFETDLPYKNSKNGLAWSLNKIINLNEPKYSNDNSILDEFCECPICKEGITKKEIYWQLNLKDKKAFTNLLIHNIYFINNLTKNIQEAIKNNELKKLEKFYLNN